MNVDHATGEAIFDSDGELFTKPGLCVYDLLNRLINHLCKLACFSGGGVGARGGGGGGFHSPLTHPYFH